MLSGTRILELSADSRTTQFCGRILAGLGAEVETVRRDSAFLTGTEDVAVDLAEGGRAGALFTYLNAQKTITRLGDEAILAGPMLEGRDVLLTAEANCAAFGAASWAELRRRHPRLVICVVTPFGLSSPLAMADGAVSDMVMQHRGGFAYDMARPVTDPNTQSPTAGADREFELAAGIAAAVACLAAVLARDVTGEGELVDFSKLDFCAHLCIDSFGETQQGVTALSRRRQGNEGIEVAGGSIWVLPCVDGLVAVSPREQQQWERWMQVLGNPEWALDQEMTASKAQRKRYGLRLQELMAAWTGPRRKADVVAAAQGARVAAFPISTARDLLANEQLVARGFFNTVATADGVLRLPGLPFQCGMSGGGTQPARGAVTLGLPAAPDERRQRAAI